ncbi:thioredoxin domain-containing protein [Dryocola clanedunensis]|uniref:hypothetical protein n=1 Tax=Cedecea sulfonylureivorans TaxID=3051154 RepID=UPI00192723B6|nr:hypothetical protein [Cedecea sulfonylureivorans]
MKAFTVTLNGSLLVVADNKHDPLFTLDLAPGSRFWLGESEVSLHHTSLYYTTLYHDAPGQQPHALFKGQCAEDARSLLAEITHGVSRAGERKKIPRLAAAALGFIMLGAVGSAAFMHQTVRLHADVPLPPHRGIPTVALMPEAQSQPSRIHPPAPVIPVTPAPAASGPGRLQALQNTAKHLAAAAQTGKYTVTLSSGHPRTLYVFADPLCENCRIIEPTLLKLAQRYNVEIFPVTLVGKMSTVNLVSPVLCRPRAERSTAWDNLFRADRGITPGQKATPAKTCETGIQALIKNDMAMKLYHIPGTPSLLADDGRFIPLRTLRSDASLQAFLNSPVTTEGRNEP